MQRTIKASNAANAASQRNRSSPTTFFGRMAQVSLKIELWFCLMSLKYNNHQCQFQGFRTSSIRTDISTGYSGMEGNSTLRSRIEAKYPALLFKQHLTACAEKIYGMIRDYLKKEISPFLNLCIQVNHSFFGDSFNYLKSCKSF